MREDREGFLYPEIQGSVCIRCEKCIKICPVRKKQKAAQNHTFEKKDVGIITLYYGNNNYGGLL